MHELERPTLVVDVSEFHEQKMELVRTYRSQFLNPMPDDYQFIGAADYLHMVRARGGYYGAMIQAAFGEPFLARSPLKITDPLLGLAGGKRGCRGFSPQRHEDTKTQEMVYNIAPVCYD